MASDSVWDGGCIVSLGPGVRNVEQSPQPPHSKHVVLAENSLILLQIFKMVVVVCYSSLTSSVLNAIEITVQ